MTDLHSHILPGIDDGAKDVRASLDILKKEQSDGVNNIALTSHFYPEKIELEEYIDRRNNAYSILKPEVDRNNLNINFKLGAEVYYSPKLSDLDARKLCIGDTDYMLMEFSTRHKQPFVKEVIYDLQRQNIIPLIAHVERYPYIMDNLEELYNLVDLGVYTQINAESFLKKGKDLNLLCKLIKWNLVHFIATDTHSIDKRPPYMKEALSVINDKIGKEYVDKLIINSDDIFNNVEIDIDFPHKPKKFLGIWR